MTISQIIDELELEQRQLKSQSTLIANIHNVDHVCNLVVQLALHVRKLQYRMEDIKL